MLEATRGNFVQCSVRDEFKSKVKHKYVHLPESTTKCSKDMDKFCQNEPESFPVPTSYNVICALCLTPSCFDDQFTTDLRAEAGYRRRQLNKDAVPALLTEKRGAAQKLKCCREIFDGLDTDKGKLPHQGETGHERRICPVTLTTMSCDVH